MRNVLFLTCFLKKGYGVSVVLDIFARKMAAQGATVAVATLDEDGFYTGFPVHRVDRTVESVRAVANKMANPIVIAATTPYFEMLRELSQSYECWAWEMGDPTPSLFPDRQAREDIIANKKIIAYPYAKGVFVLSHFLKAEIGLKNGIVIHLGSDHVPDLGCKSPAEVSNAENRPLKIGTLVRFGKGEAFYKGNHLFAQLFEELKSSGTALEYHAAGAGAPEDVVEMQRQGVVTHLNLSDEDKASYLRSLDVFISFSLWEGFNLPVVEAQALGTVGLAFDVGAHPEVTPFVCRDLAEMKQLVQTFSENRAYLLECSSLCYTFVRQRFNWTRAARQMASCLSL